MNQLATINTGQIIYCIIPEMYILLFFTFYFLLLVSYYLLLTNHCLLLLSPTRLCALLPNIHAPQPSFLLL